MFKKKTNFIPLLEFVFHVIFVFLHLVSFEQVVLLHPSFVLEFHDKLIETINLNIVELLVTLDLNQDDVDHHFHQAT